MYYIKGVFMRKKKIFYWFKLYNDFFNNVAIDYILSTDGGSDVVVIYLMLIIKSLNTNGYLYTEINSHKISIDPTRLLRDFKYYDSDVIKKTLDTLIYFGLIDYDTKLNCYFITNIKDFVGSETNYAVEKRKQREKVRKAKK